MHRKSGNAPHLRHVPAYLKDPAALAAAHAAAQAAAVVAAAQRRPKQKGRKNNRPRRQDPLKTAAAADGAQPPAAPAIAAPAAPATAKQSVGGMVFMRAPRKGGSAADQELTELEKRALAAPLRPSKAQVLAGVGGAALKAKILGPKVAALQMGAHKHNVKKIRPTMGAGAKRRR